MYYRNEVISYLQANKILALKFDRALTGLGKTVSNQIEMIGAGATRALYYTSCFTDEYQDICQKQKTEDIRFSKGAYHLLQHKGVVYDILKIYFEEVFKYRTPEQLEHIKKNTNGGKYSYCCKLSNQSWICFSYGYLCLYWHES
jgi:5'-3' exonuclease